MKKALAIIMVLMMALAAVGCTADQVDAANAAVDQAQQAVTQAVEEAAAPAEEAAAPAEEAPAAPEIKVGFIFLRLYVNSWGRVQTKGYREVIRSSSG